MEIHKECLDKWEWIGSTNFFHCIVHYLKKQTKHLFILPVLNSLEPRPIWRELNVLNFLCYELLSGLVNAIPDFLPRRISTAFVKYIKICQSALEHSAWLVGLLELLWGSLTSCITEKLTVVVSSYPWVFYILLCNLLLFPKERQNSVTEYWSGCKNRIDVYHERSFRSRQSQDSK